MILILQCKRLFVFMLWKSNRSDTVLPIGVFGFVVQPRAFSLQKFGKTADNTKIKNLTTIHSKRRLRRHFLALKFRISLTMLRNSGNEEFCCHKLAFVVRDEK